jgi:RNA polymerase sigma-70 factor, ECF subfamily
LNRKFKETISPDFQKHQKFNEKYKNCILFAIKISETSVDHYFAESELRLVIERRMAKLPPRCREIFELSRHKRLSNQEISDQLNIFERTVELQISNVLKELKSELSEFLAVWLVIWLIR